MTTAPTMTRIRGALIGLAAFVLAACSGNDGSQGPAGSPGTPGVSTASSAETLTVTVDSVTIHSPPVVNFTLTNEDGVRFTGLTSSNIRFTIAKLMPDDNGVPAHWQSYINKTEDPQGVGPDPAPATQATYDSGGSLVNNGDGTYAYTFGKDVTNITSPIAVAYQPTLTHRIGMQISGTGVPVTNATYDWRPSDGATSGIDELNIVETASCNQCHDKLAVHGGNRVDTHYCVTCHNPGSTDANTQNTVDFKVMIHKIHRGEGLTNGYTIYGYQNSVNDFSEVTYPQDIRNCTKCHDEANANTPQAHLWHDQPSIEACGACHDNVYFTSSGTGTQHTGGPATDADCTMCHETPGFFGGTPIEKHAIPAKTEGAKYAYTIVSVSNLLPGTFPSVTYKVTNPADGTAYNVKDASNPVFACVSNNAAAMCNTGSSTSAGASRLGIDIAWSTTDYTNKCAPADMGTTACQTGTTSSSAPASTISLDAIVASSNNNAAPTDNGDGTFTVTSLRRIPADAVGTATVAMEGHPAADYDGDGHYTDRVPVKSVVTYWPLTDVTAQARRTVVDIVKCDKCHDQLSLHGNNRTDEPQICAMCHNPNNTDVGRRGGTTGADGLAEQSIDFKFMVHAIHGAGKRTNPFMVYGFGGSLNDFSKVTYPGILNNCGTCHAGTSYEPPLAPNVLATTIGTGASRPDPSDDTNITPTAAVCSSCHDTTTAQTHMEQNGAAFSMVGDTGSYSETCEVCHGSGRIADVTVVHGVH